MYVCMSITGLRLKYTGLCILYIPFGTCRSGCHRVLEVEDSEDRRRRQNESRCHEMYGRQLANCSTKDDKIMTTRNNLRVTTRAISLVPRPLSEKSIFPKGVWARDYQAIYFAR